MKANVSLSQIIWKTVPQLQTCSCKTPVFIVAVCSSHYARPRCGRTQLMMTFVGDQLTVGGRIGWSHAIQQQVDQGGEAKEVIVHAVFMFCCEVYFLAVYVCCLLCRWSRRSVYWCGWGWCRRRHGWHTVGTEVSPGQCVHQQLCVAVCANWHLMIELHYCSYVSCIS